MLKDGANNGGKKHIPSANKTSTTLLTSESADSTPSSWSSWEWSAENFIFWRARKLLNDTWEYDYEHPESTSRVVILSEKSKSLVSTAAIGYSLAPEPEYVQEKSCEYVKEKPVAYEGIDDRYTFAPIIQEAPISGMPEPVQETLQSKGPSNRSVDAGTTKAEFLNEEEMNKGNESAQTESTSKPKSDENYEHTRPNEENSDYKPPRIRSEKLAYVEEWRRSVQDVLKNAPKGILKKPSEMPRHRKFEEKRRPKSMKWKSRYIVEIVDD
ncbi:hypothetical protein BGZ60DRAFT_532187 [Tricladium varicosporioides]|nr:hypothetical protein BGZ60DRAFT_532187 [Hymenoscyphus varicosporioides]